MVANITCAEWHKHHRRELRYRELRLPCMNTTGKPPRSRARPYVRHASFRPSRRSIVTAGIFMLRRCLANPIYWHCGEA